MNWNISAWSIRKPIPSILLFLILSIAGLISYFNIGIDENPNIDLPTISVSISESGAAPSELESQVARRVEDAVAGLGNIKHITTTINEGVSQTQIEFELGTNTDRALNDVRDAVTRIRSQLPSDIEEPTIQRVDFVGGPFATYTVSSKTFSVKELSWLIDNDVSRALLSVKGVGQVQRAGGVDREINVDLDPSKLEAVGVSADIINAQVKYSNTNMAGGRGSIGAQEQSIRTLGSSASIDNLKNMRLALQNGTWASLESLGKVTDGVAEPRQAALLDGKPAVAFSVVRSVGSNLADVGKGVDKALEQLQKTLPADIEIVKIRTNLNYVMDSYHATIDSLLLGAALAIAVIWLFLRDWRASAISALAMPLSMVPTFAVMKLLGFTLNNMSLLGLALVIGILVDDAIVEIENIVRHMQMGKKPLEAALEAADEIGLAVIATTMTIIVVFLPVAFMGGIPGQFFKQFGVTVAVAVFFSLLVARLLTPMMAAFGLKGHVEDQPAGNIQKFFDKLLHWALKHRGKTIATAGGIFILSVALLASLPTSLVNSADRGESLVSVELPPGATLDATTAASARITNLLLAHKEVEHVFASVGTPATTGMKAGGSGTVNKANLYVILKERGKRSISQQQFEDMARPELAKVPGTRTSISATMGLGGKVQILLVGRDEIALKRTTEQLTNEMRGVEGISDVKSSSALKRPEIQVIPDFAKASDHGVSVQQIARTATMATVGDADFSLAKFDLADRQIGIRVQIDPKYREDIDSIGRLKIASFKGPMIPLNEVATVKFGSGPAQIDRFDRDRQVTISATLMNGTTLGQALKRIHSLPAFQNLPDTVRESVSGDVEIQRDVFSGFGMAIAAAVVLIYAVLVLLFNDFLHPLTIMMSLPMSVGGAALGLIIAHQSVGLYALIGIVMLMGLVTKNAILLVEYCLMAMHKGTPRDEAIIGAVEARMRPILMTTVAMIVGMIPIALGIGAGSEVRAPMAVAVVGGLITSTFLTLIVVPVVFTYIDDLKQMISKHRKAKKSESKAQVAQNRDLASTAK